MPEVSALEKSAPMRLNPDLDFIRILNAGSGDSLKKCFQCGTCSATCAISPQFSPFPRKEMARAAFGIKEELLSDPDIWLCYQCNDCSLRCPRGARPGDVLAAIRKECVLHFAFPRFLAGWVSHPRFLPVLLAIPVLLLGLAIVTQKQLAAGLNINQTLGEKIVYSHTVVLPHWLLNLFFSFFSALTLLIIIIGVARYWRAVKTYAMAHGEYKKPSSESSSIAHVLKRILTHEQFASCEATKARFISHFLVFFGFLALSMVTFWVITSGWNPLANTPFVYPFSFFSPWKILANIGGAAIGVGCLLMFLERIKKDSVSGKGTYFDWFFILTLISVVLSGFATEALHYLRLEPHRHVVYFVHLVLVFVLLMNLPFTKFAHLAYRTVALVFASRMGREREVRGAQSSEPKGDGHDK